jgi:glyoxylase-like metal-dependent hydrolase (beta-lactamase superfamily II)
MNLQIETILSMPFAENSYLVWRLGATEAVIIDPGLDPEAILQVVAERKLNLVAILNTHGHADHIAGNEAMKTAFPDAPLVIGLRDAPLLTDPVRNVSRAFGFDIISPPADVTVEDGQTLHYAGIVFEIREIPGHSPGHVVFVIQATDPPTVFGGDVLFQGSIGRTDFPGGSMQTLLSGIRNKLFPLDDDTIVFPGHGDPTTIGDEKETNPFLR